MAVPKKVLKRQTLRNIEYYGLQEIFDELYQKSLENRKFRNLMELILMEENIKLAYRNMKKNDGSTTPGVDGKTIEHLAKMTEKEVIELVRNKLEWYTPKAIRRVEIDKGNGKKRPLGIASIEDRLIQQCILQVLEPICEAKFHDRSNGFRPNRGVENALAQAEKLIQSNKLYIVVDIDIKGFFDNVSHGKLLKQLWTIGIQDKKLISIISAMLKGEIAEIGFPEKGTAQGSIISPLLSNVVLNELDWWIASQWEFMPTRHVYKEAIKANGTQSKSKKYRALRNSTLKECFIVRYADDFKIFCRKHKDAVVMFEATKQWLKTRLTFIVNTNVDRNDIDHPLHLYHRIELTFSTGRLCLVNTHGPVIWLPFLHMPRDEYGTLSINVEEEVNIPSGVTIGNVMLPSVKETFEQIWPDAVKKALEILFKQNRTEKMSMAQYQIYVSKLWSEICQKVGYMNIVDYDNFGDIKSIFYDLEKRHLIKKENDGIE